MHLGQPIVLYKVQINVKYLNNLITRELEERDISSIASHQIAVQDAQYALMGND